MEGMKDKVCDICTWITSYLKERGYWAPLKHAVKFLIHFVVVMVFLYCGAIIFAVLEDSDAIFVDKSHHLVHTPRLIRNNVNRSAHSNTTRNGEDASVFWANIEAKYNISVREDIREGLRRDICNFPAQKHEKVEHVTHEGGKENKECTKRDRHYIFMKWFYFVTTSTTTIGYGHVHPTTDNGKVFYIFFSIIGIALMMTLLKKCGTILTAVNTRVCSLFIRHVFRNKKFVSDELMSVVSISIMFIVFMLFVVWHDQEIDEATQWSVIDCFYFWIVTFTTVGFGDVHFTLDAEIDHMYEMLFYRIFGLSFLAGIIDSIQTYVKYRNREIAKKLSRSSTQFRDKLIGNGKRSAFAMIEAHEKMKVSNEKCDGIKQCDDLKKEINSLQLEKNKLQIFWEK